MKEKIKNFLKNKNYDGLHLFIQQSDLSELCYFVLRQISLNFYSIPLNCVLSGLSMREECQWKRYKLMECVLDEIKKGKITSIQASDLVSRIARDFPVLSKQYLIKLVDYCISRIQNNDDVFFCWRSILPIILRVLEEKNYVGYRCDGPMYKSFIKAIFNQPWSNSILTPLAEMFGNISLTKADHEFVIRTFCDKIFEIEVSELSPLVHQLLRLSNSRDNHLIIKNLQKYFSKEYSEARDQLSMEKIQKTESTILDCIRQSTLKNQFKGFLKDFIRNLKNIIHAPEFILDSFLLTLLLSISDIYEDRVFDIIKLAIARKIQEDEKQKSQAWVEKILPENSCEVMDIMNQIINKTGNDRHLVLNGLIDLSFVLLEFRKSNNNEANKMHMIGIEIIKKLIDKYHEIGSRILEKLIDKIVTNGTSISQYTQCLFYMCEKSTVTVLNSLVWISKLLDHLLTIPGESATQVLHAIMPLMHVSQHLRDNLVMILHKALNRKKLSVKKIAITGFVQFLKIIIPEDNYVIYQEILGTLSECFYHEYEIRQHLYAGLSDAACHNQKLAEPIIEMLLNHLLDFYEKNEDIQPPLKFQNCLKVDQNVAILREPIGDLIFALQKIYCLTTEKNSCTFDKLYRVLESLYERIIKAGFGYLSAEDKENILTETLKVQQKIISMKLLYTVVEALITFRFNNWTDDFSSVIGLVDMFLIYNVITDVSKNVVITKKRKSKNKKDAMKKIQIIELPNTILDLDVGKKILSLIYNTDIDWASREQIDFVKFHEYFLRTCINIFQNEKQLINIKGFEYCEYQSDNYFAIGEIFYKKILSDMDEMKSFDDEIVALEFECFKNLIDTMYTVEVSDDLILQALRFFSCFQDLVNYINKEIIYKNENTILRKILLTIFETISLLIEKSFTTDVSYKNIFQWLIKISKSNTIDDDIALIIIKLITAIETHDTKLTIVDTMCKELSQRLGMISWVGVSSNEEEFVEKVYTVFTENTMTRAHNIFNNYLKTEFDNALWILNRLKAEQIVSVSPGIGGEFNRKKLIAKEKILCRKLSSAVQVLITLADSLIDPGKNTEATFKNFQKICSILSNLTRYFNNKSTRQNPAYQSAKFIQVVHLAGKKLKSAVYNLITHTEESQSCNHGTSLQAQKNQVLENTKFIPKVVHEVEKFHQEILILEKKTGVPLSKHLMHSMTRDFRIKKDELSQGLENLSVTSQLCTPTPTSPSRASSAESDGEAPPCKKAKKN